MNSRIDQLRESLAGIGEEQLAYWRFFGPFSEQLEQELGQYLGEPSSVALAPFEGEFTFDNGSYRQSGLCFRHGRFVIPLMVRLRNLKDSGETLIRVHLCCSLVGERVVAEFEGCSPVSVERSNVELLLKYIHEYLASACGHAAWFAENPSNYQGTTVGFTRPA